MADKKIVDLTAIGVQAGTDLYEVSLNGAGSRKETRDQQVAYLSNLFAPQFTAENTVWVDPAGNNANPGTQSEPYADPYYATNQVTGSLANPKTVNVGAGIYSLNQYLVKPNVNVQGQRYTKLDLNSVVELFDDWSGEPDGSVSYFTDCEIDFGFDLDFNSAPNFCALGFYNSQIGGSFLATTSTGHAATIIAYGSRFGSIGMSSVNSQFIGCDIVADIGLAAGTSGAATSSFVGCLFNSSTDVTISGTSGNLQTGYFSASPIRSSLTLDGIYGRLTTDAISIPAAGITYANSATSSQVTLIGNAPAKCLNNAYTAQNYIVPVAITSTSNATAWNLNTAPSAKSTLTENTTISAPSNQIEGAIYILKLVQGATPFTVAYNSVFKFPQGVIPVMSTGNGAVDIYTFYSDGTNMRCVGISQNIS